MTKAISEDTFIDAYRRSRGRTIAQCALQLLGWLEREGYIEVRQDGAQ